VRAQRAKEQRGRLPSPLQPCPHTFPKVRMTFSCSCSMEVIRRCKVTTSVLATRALDRDADASSHRSNATERNGLQNRRNRARERERGGGGGCGGQKGAWRRCSFRRRGDWMPKHGPKADPHTHPGSSTAQMTTPLVAPPTQRPPFTDTCLRHEVSTLEPCMGSCTSVAPDCS
jgi:hypothetical protein